MKVIKNSKNNYILLLTAFLFALIFVIICYGVKPLNIFDESWIFERGGVILQHHLGWKAFRNSSWSWPLGAVEGLTYPDKISIIYLDSIPGMAILFKLLSPILPNTVQYMGIFVLISFFLQCFIAMKIVEHFSKNMWHIIFGGMLLGISPTMIFRVFFHTALSAHFLILFAIYIWIVRREISLKREILYLGILGFCCTMIHFYFVPIVGLVILGGLSYDLCLKRTTLVRVIVALTTYLIVAFFSFCLLGGFDSSFTVMSQLVDYYNANLNTFVNGYGRSVFFSTIPSAYNGQYEGYCCLGLGWFLLIFYAALRLVDKRGELDKSYIIKAFTVMGVFFLLVLFLSVGEAVTFGKIVIKEISYPEPINSFFRLFRSNGRFVWCIAYFLSAVAIAVVLKYTKNDKYISILLVVCFVLQAVEVYPYFNVYKSWTEGDIKTESTDKWELLAENMQHIMYLPGGQDRSQENKLYSLVNWAIDNGITINDFFFSRSRTGYAEPLKNQFRDELDKGNMSEKTMVVFDDIFEPANRNWKLHYYNIDNYIIGTRELIDGLNEIDYANGITIDLSVNEIRGEMDYTEKDGLIINNAYRPEGPYWNLGEGNYRIIIEGYNLENLQPEFKSSVDVGQVDNVRIIEATNEKCVVDFDVESFYYGAYWLFNCNKDEDRTISEIRIEKR